MVRATRRIVDDAAIPQLLALPRLEVLDLADTGISAEGVQQLQQNGRLKRLLVTRR